MLPGLRYCNLCYRVCVLPLLCLKQPPTGLHKTCHYVTQSIMLSKTDSHFHCCVTYDHFPLEATRNDTWQHSYCSEVWCLALSKFSIHDQFQKRASRASHRWSPYLLLDITWFTIIIRGCSLLIFSLPWCFLGLCTQVLFKEGRKKFAGFFPAVPVDFLLRLRGFVTKWVRPIFTCLFSSGRHVSRAILARCTISCLLHTAQLTVCLWGGSTM